MKIPTFDSQHQINTILTDDDDARVAIWMSKILSKALQNKLQQNLKVSVIISRKIPILVNFKEVISRNFYLFFIPNNADAENRNRGFP